MAARLQSQTDARTQIARRRAAAGISQRDMSEYLGMSLSQYRRLERGQAPNPSVRSLANCAIVLGCALEELLQDQWRQWHNLGWQGEPRPPSPVKVARRAAPR